MAVDPVHPEPVESPRPDRPVAPWSIRLPEVGNDYTFGREAMAKVLSWFDGGAATRLLRESRIISLLDHPAVVSAHDLDAAGQGRSYLVLRQSTGTSLAELIRNSTEGQRDLLIATPEAVVSLILRVCEALEHAHALGVVHRDLRPDHILVGHHGEVVLSGWGAARMPDERPSPDQTGADPRDDIFALGATLYHALLLRNPMAGDATAPPAPTERRAFPAALQAIVRQAMAADPARRYQRVADLRADLQRFQEGLSTSALPERWPVRAARVLWRRRKSVAAGTLMLATSGFLLGLLLLELSRSVAFWGVPIVDERFTDQDWQKRWRTDPADSWHQEGDRVVTHALKNALLVYPRRLYPPLAVEYDGEILPSTMPCDLSAIWWEGPGLESDRPIPIYHDGATPSCWVQFGAQDNQFSAIFRRPGNQQVAFSRRKLEINRRYRMRVEFEKDAVRAFVDGELWMEHKQLFPVRSGYLALYGFYAGKAFGNIRIWSKGVPQRLPVMAAGDAAFMYGQWRMAADEWGRVGESFSGRPEAADAALRIGMAELKLGEREAAETSWKGLVGEHADIAAASLVEDSWERQDVEGFATAFTRLWREKPQQRERLATIWSTCLGRIPGGFPARSDRQLRLLLQLRDTLFPDHAATVCDATELKIYAGRAAEIAASAEYPRNQAFALLALGRNREVLSQPNAYPDTDYLARLALGEIDGILASQWVKMTPCGRILAKADRKAEALALNDDPPLLQVLLGNPSALRPGTHQWPGNANAAAIQCGLLEEAAGPPKAWDVGGSWIAQVLLRREDQPDEAFHGRLTQLQQARWLRALEDGGKPDPELTAAVAGGMLDHRRWGGWFIPWFAQPFVEGRLTGDAGRTYLDSLADSSAETFARRPHFLARLIAGKINLTAFLGQPIAAEGEGWWQVGTAMRAELDGDRALALASYRAFQALPMQRRLLEHQEPDPFVERFVAWRMMVLGLGR